ncbi:MAG: choice-of-anchor D domain-containing protein [Phycisphaerales bacterium]|nr:choice-of-anchor D domain-containing protein [Phycisphaerales bacterium]
MLQRILESRRRAQRLAYGDGRKSHAARSGATSGRFIEALEERRLLAADLVATVDVGVQFIDPGDPFLATITVQNTGDEEAAASRLEVRLDLNDVFGGSDDVIVSWEDLPAIPAGGMIVLEDLDFVAPDNTPAGTYAVSARADAFNQVDEANENNNTGISSHVVNYNGPAMIANANYFFFGASTDRSTYAPGETVTLTATLFNNGPDAIPDPVVNSDFELHAHLDQNRVPGDPDDIAFTSQSAPRLGGNANTDVITFLNIPANTPDGDYTAYFFANGFLLLNEPGDPASTIADNFGFATTITIASSALPDLEATLDVLSPVPVAPGATYDVAFSIENPTGIDAPSSLIRFVLTTDEEIGNADDITVSEVQTGTIPGFASFGGTNTVTIPANLPTGNYRVAVVADADNVIEERDETNNIVISGFNIVENSPDIFGVLFDIIPGAAAPGESIQVQWAISNGSLIDAGESATRIVLSRDGNFGDPSDVTLFEDRRALTAGETVVFDEMMTIPANLAPGTWQLALIVDADDEVIEFDETNNIDQTVMFSVEVAEFRPDLALTADFTGFTPPLSVGQSVAVPVVIANETIFDAGASTLRLVLSLDETLGNSDDVEVASISVDAIEAHGGRRLELIGTIPSTLPEGSWRLGVIADADDAVFEQDETNNTAITNDPVITIEPTSPPPPPPPPTGQPNIAPFGGAMLDQPLGHELKARRAEGTGFGPVELVSGTKDIVYQIRNTGDTDLVISSIEPRGQVPGDYEVIILPDFIIPAGSSTTFTVRFDPSEFGTRRANIAIFTNDPDRPRFTMKVAGRGVPHPSLPDVAVTGGTRDISDNDRKARPSSGQRYGQVDLGQTVTLTYTVTNTGGSTLTLGQVTVDSNLWTIVQQPGVSSLAPNESTTFVVSFTPSDLGKHKAFISLASDDPDEAVFNFRVIGVGVPI